jgi:predicted YcjX-like family ATPase
MIVPVLVIGLAVGATISWRAARSRARREARRELARAWADMRREVNHWQEAAARANAEVARVAREADAYKAGHKNGREDVISIIPPLLVAAQQRPADEARAGGDQR